MPKQLRCWLCAAELRARGRSREIKGASNGTCAEHIRFLREEDHCRSGDDCDQRAGFGPPWHQFCETHAAELEAIRDGREASKFNGRTRHEIEAKTKKQRVPREVTAAKVAAIVRAADGPMTTVEITRALGKGKGDNSVRRAVTYAHEQRWLALVNGRGWEAGDVEPPLPPPADESTTEGGNDSYSVLSRSDDASETDSHGESASTSEMPATSLAA